MPLKRPQLLLLTAFLISSQLSCARSGTSEPAPVASPTPTEQAVIDQIFERYQKALGTEEAIAAITSLKMKGTFDLSGRGVVGTIEGWRKENKTLTVMEFPRIGTLKKGFDGETRWLQTPQGTYSSDDTQEIAELERDAEVFSVGKIRSLFESMKLENNARLTGREVRVIEGKPAKGPSEKLFFDVDSGLLIRWDMARRTANRGTVFVRVHLEDYRDVGGVKIPFIVRFAFESFTFRIKLEDVQYNVPIDDAIFKKP
jgi:hypothetical protein